ncbi:ThuA domain-containing protein [Lutibacter sp. HS1-25]|uniref:ThuA domain-containing protein n=1 Tax=Lutibacter sp. HS1-25 TaxID=2485000 RepID=UPI001010D04D|nr:ThuA domain-containing protein [Lutibacter sp. HS1-25]RXP57878.1 ThuA domain-containing protein [Lutibacter sp. HS1-25]
MKHKVIHLSAIALLLFFTTSIFSQESMKLASLKNKRVLLVYGGWEGHQPEAFAKRVNEWLQKEGAIVTLSDSLGVYTQKEIMENTDIIIQHWTMGQISKEQSNALQKAVKNGVGLAGCHGGLGDSFRNNTGYQYMIGGQFVAHPGGLINYTVKISNEKSPISKGLKSFDIKHTEQYYMHIDPKVKVLATTTFSNTYDYWIEGAVMPICWTTKFGKGNIFYLSIGHDPQDFDNYESWQLLTRGIKWVNTNH